MLLIICKGILIYLKKRKSSFINLIWLYIRRFVAYKVEINVRVAFIQMLQPIPADPTTERLTKNKPI